MEQKEKTLDGEQILASAVYFLLDGGSEEDRDAATILLSCSLNVIDEEVDWERDDEDYVIGNQYHWYHVRIECPRKAYDVLNDNSDARSNLIYKAIEAVLPSERFDARVRRFNIRGQLIKDISPNIREELHEVLGKKAVSNQGNFIKPENVKTWNGFQFASLAEVQIARALDEVGVLFLPNCKMRLRGGQAARVSYYPDFLICYQGKWGILEVDGPTHYTQSKVISDRMRDENCNAYGVYVKHFDWQECEAQHEEVVRRFLNLLMKNG